MCINYYGETYINTEYSFVNLNYKWMHRNRNPFETINSAWYKKIQNYKSHTRQKIT